MLHAIFFFCLLLLTKTKKMWLRGFKFVRPMSATPLLVFLIGELHNVKIVDCYTSHKTIEQIIVVQFFGSSSYDSFPE